MQGIFSSGSYLCKELPITPWVSDFAPRIPYISLQKFDILNGNAYVRNSYARNFLVGEAVEENPYIRVP